MAKNTEDNTEGIKKEFDDFINTYRRRAKSKYIDVLEPYWQHIRKAVNMGIPKKKIHEFLIAHKIDIKFSTFCAVIRQQNVIKKPKSKHE